MDARHVLADVIADGYELDWQDQFDDSRLDRSRWLPFYLPQWSSRARAAARYELVGGRLGLLIEHGQPPWCPEFDGATKVSSLQTGVHSGAVGSGVGQHRFSPDAVVREAQTEERLYTPLYGVFELRARMPVDPSAMAALWMIGFEDRPERSAEICVCEVFGRDVGDGEVKVGMGVHPFGDPSIVDDFEQVPLRLDVREPHVYAAEWAKDRVSFFLDGRPVRHVPQSPGYPMQLMLGIYEFSGQQGEAGRYPLRFEVDWVRAYRPR